MSKRTPSVSRLFINLIGRSNVAMFSPNRVNHQPTPAYWMPLFIDAQITDKQFLG